MLRNRLGGTVAAVLSALLSLAAVAAMTGCSRQSKESRVVVGQVRINEVMSANSYYAPLPDGSCYDWIELYNASGETVNLKGCMLSDNLKLAKKWVIPSDLPLEPHGYCLIYLSGLNKVDENGNFHTNFRLSSRGEELLFSNEAGVAIQQLSLPASSMSNVSYGWKKDGYVWYAEPSPGRENAGNTADTPEALVMPESGVVINEYMTKNTYVLYDGNNRYSDWIELYNSSDSDVSLGGYSLSDTEGGGKWFFPQDAVIGAKAYLIVFCTDEPSPDPNVLHADFGLSAGETLTLFSLTGQAVDAVKLAQLHPNVSCGRDPDSGEFRLFASPTPGKANTTYSYELTSRVTAAPVSPVFVSEALCVSGQDGEFKNDFVEIHNTSSKAVSLKGYGLSKSDEGAAFVFPDVSLEADGYTVVYCSGKNVSQTGKTLHAAFKLDQGGEDIFFFDPDGHIIDILSSGRQTSGHSSGRVDARKNEVVVFETPTPGQSNSGVKTYAGYAPTPLFSSEGGYVSKGFQLTMTVPEGCTVYYTTDGNAPDRTSSVYSAPVTIRKSTVVRAAAYRKGCLMSQTVYATFLVEEAHTIPVVSVSSPPDGLFSPSRGILYGGAGGLVPGKANYLSNEKREATFEYFVDGRRAAYFRAGVKIFGGASRAFEQKALAVIMSEIYGANECAFPFFGAYSADTFEALLLRPSGQDWSRSHIRDEFCSRIVRDSTIRCDYQEAQPVALYLNGEYWGLYYLREKLNEDYLVHKYGYTKGSIDIIKWEGAAQAGSLKERKELQNWCDTHDLREKKNYEYVCSQVDIDSLIDWWVFETYVGNDDTGNVRCCRSRTDGKWHWMLYDLDDAFHLAYYRVNYISRYAMNYTHGYDVLAVPDSTKGSRNALMYALLKNKDFQAKFITAYCRHIKTTFAPERLTPLLEELNSEIEPEMARQTARWGKPSDSQYRRHMDIIRDIINKKPEIAKNQIKEAFRLTDAQMKKYYDQA